MDGMFKYTVLVAIPDKRRGEKVNIGLAVFNGARLDVRFQYAFYKLRALTGEGWEMYLELAHSRFAKIYGDCGDPELSLSEFASIERVIQPSALGYFIASSPEEYESRISELMEVLIGPKARERKEQQTRINTEIATEFRRHKVLAQNGDALERGLIVRDLVVEPSEGIVADFALRNGKMHIASTLDLRIQSGSIERAALKAIVLDKAKKFSDVRKIAVYAVDESMRDRFSGHIRLLNDYADDIYNWSNPEEKISFQRSFYDALPSVFTPI